MPASRSDAARPQRAPVPATGIVLTLLLIAAVCLLAIGAADSSIEPGDGWATTPAITAE